MKLLNIINKILVKFKKPNNISKCQNILVVSNTGLGDTILSTPAIVSLRKSFQEVNITFMVHSKMYPLFQNFEFVDDFIIYSNKFWNQILNIKKIRAKKIDTIFLFHSNGPEDVFFSILSGASNILKMTDNQNYVFQDILINKPNQKNQHIIENRLDLLRLCNAKKLSTRLQLSSIFYNQNTFDFPTTKQIAGVQVGAQDSYKMWSKDNFIKVIDFLLQKNHFIVLFGATALEKQLTNEIANFFNTKNLLNLCCRSSVEELPYMVKKLNFLLTNDTGIMHLAIALKTPTISLFGPTDSNKFGPYQDADIHTVIQKNGDFVNNVPKKQRKADGINLISANEVINEITQRF